MKAKGTTHPQYKSGPITTYEALVGLRALHSEALAGATEADRRYLKSAIASIDQILKLLKTKRAKRKHSSAPPCAKSTGSRIEKGLWLV
jgi:hypothetical protein